MPIDTDDMFEDLHGNTHSAESNARRQWRMAAQRTKIEPSQIGIEDVDQDGYHGDGRQERPPKYPGEQIDLKCGECGKPMRLREGSYGIFYGCSTYPDCTGTHNAHPDGSPNGIPTNKKTREARVRAHAAFDMLWQKGNITRGAAYVWLQKTMGMTAQEAHIGNFTIVQCERLIPLAKKYYDDLKHPTIWMRLMQDD